MDSATSTIHHLPEAILTEILARLPLRSISRFKSVSKAMKATLESVYFRRLFLSLHKDSSSSWSLSSHGGKELIGFHGCNTWDLPKSLGSFISLPLGYDFKASSNGLVLFDKHDCSYVVGNPVLQQWVKIPQPATDHSVVLGLVTRVDEDGRVLGFKVVRLGSVVLENGHQLWTLNMFVYSSETGIWTCKILYSPYLIISNLGAKNLNGTIYFVDIQARGVFIAHDFYSESDHFMVVHYPEHSNYNSNNNNSVVNGALTTSGGFIIYMKSLVQERGTVLKVWRLHNDGSWQLLCENGLSLSGSFVPIAMHPFDSDIVYLCHQRSHLVSCNLRTETLMDPATQYHGDFYMDQSGFEEYVDKFRALGWDYTVVSGLFQSVLPRWMEPVPRPPQVEMIDTTSLLSQVAC